MRKSYVIQWRSTVNGRVGKGTKLFELAEAKALAEELNREYPDILHTPIEANPRKAAIDAGESREITEEAEIAAEVGQVAQSPDYAFSA